MKLSPRFIGFLQAAGLTLYVAGFAIFATHIQEWARARGVASPTLGITIFLLAFVISALISGSLLLGYPLVLFFGGKKAEALKIVLWSALWLLVCLAFVTVFGLLSIR